MKAKGAQEPKGDPGPEEPGRCNAIRRSGRRCRQPAGRGTPHSGSGPCKECAGSTPNVIKRYARLEAIGMARQFLDSDVEIEPLEAALLNVKIAASLVRYQQAKIRGLRDDQITREDERALEEAVMLSQRVTDMALRAGIAERLVNIAERAGEQIALIGEAGLRALVAAGVVLDEAQRVAFARAVEAETGRLEDEPVRQLPVSTS